MLAFNHWRYREKCPRAAAEAEKLRHVPVDEQLVRRVSGRVICETCCRELYEHPPHPTDDWLQVTCDGEIVKL